MVSGSAGAAPKRGKECGDICAGGGGLTWHKIIQADNGYRVDVRGSGRYGFIELLPIKDVIRIVLEPLDAL